jgi:ribose-phosphate pyrophosphokinase
MEIIKYPDGSSYVQERNSPGFATFKINSYEDLWHLNQYVDAYNNFNKGGMRPIITIPCLIDAQADRRFNIGESSGLKLVCQFLNNMNADFKIFHPHNPEIVEALMDNVEIIDNTQFINKVLAKLTRETKVGQRYFTDYYLNNQELKDSLILMSSDAGGFKPLMKLCDKIGWQGETYSASKARLWDGEKSNLVQQIQCEDFEGKDILIIDDILVGGKTFLGIAELLQTKNVGKLYLAVSHITIPTPNKDLEKYFTKIFTTDSKGLNYNLNNLEVINIF